MAGEDSVAKPARTKTDAADSPEPTTGTSEPADDTEGHTFLPDRSGEHLAQARERDIRQHLSRRQMEIAAKKQKRR